MRTKVTGALVGWKRESASHGIVLTMQIAEAADDFSRKDFTHVNLALNDRQLRSLARDIGRAAAERGLDINSKPSLWKKLFPPGISKRK